MIFMCGYENKVPHSKSRLTRVVLAVLLLALAMSTSGCTKGLTSSEQASVEKFQVAVAAIGLGHYGNGEHYQYLENNVQQMIDLMRRDPDATYKGRRMIEVLADDQQIIKGDDYDDLSNVDNRLENAIRLELGKAPL